MASLTRALAVHDLALVVPTSETGWTGSGRDEPILIQTPVEVASLNPVAAKLLLPEVAKPRPGAGPVVTGRLLQFLRGVPFMVSKNAMYTPELPPQALVMVWLLTQRVAIELWHYGPPNKLSA